MFLITSRRSMRSGFSGCGGFEMTAWIWIGCTVATLVTSQQNFYTNGRYGKRQDPEEASSFWSGSRYGRSGVSGADKEKIEEAGKDMEVSPRTDRFFLGSRYGKRTFSNNERVDSLKHFKTTLDFLISVDRQTTEKEQLKVLSQQLKDNENVAAIGSGENLSLSVDNLYRPRAARDEKMIGFACLYTGIGNLYRCSHRRSNATQGSSN
ncbi:uncharacterized protein LOC124302573 [Neodiprion virginianus]|uniref:uncharacterized protein LOC124302573 n=1 Tax=Neodiprion virginianus TaxID=2961670 RepID=UPI001EE6C214|nr:uncharacterized protein LOC124302573 [Neodiprion virginianus]